MLDKLKVRYSTPSPSSTLVSVSFWSSIALVAVVLSVQPALATASQVRPTMTLARGSSSMALQSATAIEGGGVETTWTARGLTVRVAGAPGSTVMVKRLGPHRAVVGLIPPSTGSGRSSNGGSLYWNARAVGANSTRAAAMARRLGVAAPGANPLATAASSDVFNKGCVDIDMDEHYVEGTSCMLQSWLQTGSGSCGCWLSENEITTSAFDAASDSDLTQLNAAFCYCNGDHYTRDTWAPSSDQENATGDAVTYGFSASFDGFGISVSDTVQSHSEIGPYNYNGPYNAAFGAVWSGSNNDFTTDAANSNAIVNPGVGSPGKAGLYVGAGWTCCSD
jgi:hypothetical protein